MDIKIYKHGSEIHSAFKLIDKFKLKNNIDFTIKLYIDFETNHCGYFNWGEDVIYLNPNLCSEPKNSEFGYTDDCGVSSVIIHEFSHFLDDKFDLLSEYIDMVSDYGHCYLNTYSKSDIVEELAEVICLYIVNPYMLKIINTHMYLWIKQKFKSPTPCSEKTFIKKWNTWNKPTHKKCLKKWKFVVENEKIMYISV